MKPAVRATSAAPVAANQSSQLRRKSLASRFRQQALLLKISEDLANARDRDDLFRTFSERIRPLFGFDTAVVSNYSPDLHSYRHLLINPSPKVQAHPAFSQVISHFFSMAGSPNEYILARFDEDDLYYWHTEDMAARYPDHILIPFLRETELYHNVHLALRYQSRLIGLFHLHYAEQATVPEQQFELLRAVAIPLAGALDNILAKEAIAERIREKAEIMEVAHATVRVRDKPDLLKLVMHQIQPLFDFSNCGLFVLSPDGKYYTDWTVAMAAKLPAAASEAVAASGPARQPHAGSVVAAHMAQAVQAGGPISIDIAAEAQRYPGCPFLKAAMGRGNRQALAGPLTVGNQTLGIFYISYQAEHGLPEAHRTLFQAITIQLGLAVANILATEQLVAREQERALQLAVIAALQSADSWPARLRAVAEALQPYIPFVFAALGVNTPASPVHVASLRQVGLREYEVLGHVGLANVCRIAPEELTKLRAPLLQQVGRGVQSLHTGAEFVRECEQQPYRGLLARTFGLASNVEVPVPLRGGGFVVMSLYSSDPAAYTPAHQALLASLAGPFTNTIEKLLAFDEVQLLKTQLEGEKHYLETEIKSTYNFEEIVGASPVLQEVYKQVRQVAPTDATVLLTGETGTGKELFARALHDASPRRGKVLVKLNCAALPAQLIESELFGHEKGAFTGAVERRIGKFELAHGSTLFLDEIGELPLDLQVKLLRVLQEKEVERLGGNHVIKVDVRVVAATNRVLEDEVAAGRFRADLYYRLSVFPIRLPALRERRDDLPLLARHFLRKFARRFGRSAQRLAPGALEALRAHAWPGNVRELEHVIEQAMVLNTGPELSLAQPLGSPQPIAAAGPGPLPWQEAERANILAALGATGGRVHGPAGAAALLRIHPNTLDSRMRKLGIQKTFALVSGPPSQ